MKRVLLVLALLSLAAGSAIAQNPPEWLVNNPHPEVERLLAAADRIPAAELSVQQLSALQETPELVARMLADDGVGAHLSYAGFRRHNAGVYGVFLARQLGLDPSLMGLRKLFLQDAGSVGGHMCRYRQVERHPQAARQFVEEQARLRPEVDQRARAIWNGKLPLNQEALAGFVERVGAQLSPAQLARLNKMLPAITPVAVAWVEAHHDVAPAHLIETVRAYAIKPRLGVQPQRREPDKARRTPPAPPRHVAREPDSPGLPVIPMLAFCAALLIGALRLWCRGAASGCLLVLCCSPIEAQQPKDPPYPVLEQQLAQADLINTSPTALLLARLAVTPAILARAVVEDGVADYLASGWIYKRGEWAKVYGIYLARQVGVAPDSKAAGRCMQIYRLKIAGYLGRFYMVQHKPAFKTLQLAYRQNPDWGKAREFLELKVPLDVDVLGEVLHQSRRLEATPSRIRRLAALWGRLDPSGVELLRRRKASLTPLVRELIKQKGIPTGRQ